MDAAIRRAIDALDREGRRELLRHFFTKAELKDALTYREPDGRCINIVLRLGSVGSCKLKRGHPGDCKYG